MPARADSRGSALDAMTAVLPAQAATTSPIRLARPASTGPNQPSEMASSRLTTQADGPRTSRQVPSTSAAAPAFA
jgi:hypothetical protein